MTELHSEQPVEPVDAIKPVNWWGLPPEKRDELTLLYNRAAFCEKVQEMISQREPGYYILSYINIDDFKYINDQYGVEVGDEVLRHIALCFGECLADMAGICARFSADNFAILFPSAYEDSSRVSAMHARSCAPACITQRIHIRVGRCHVDDTSLSAYTIYDHAKLAAKTVRGIYGSYVQTYTEAMRDDLVRRRRILDNMDDALRNNEFEVWLQPQYNHATGAVIGAEALARWRHDGDYISPAEFVPVFEDCGFIYEMDKYMWEQCCVLLRRWLDEGRAPLPISVNISRCDILHEDFSQTINDLVAKYDIPIALLRLEVTESAFSDAARLVIRKVGNLIRMGYTVEIDDFGSAYSTLNSLKDVPAAILKLDMRFFEDAEDSQRAGSIVESVVRMAKWLGMAVIAEGVETKEQADYLKSIGCFYIQGYYYARPMPVGEYEALVQSAQKEPQLTRLKMLETFDNSEFWNPKSMDTLIFNSYIGGACIFEYTNGRIEMLRINDQFVLQFNGVIPRGTEMDRMSPSHLLTPEELARFLDTIKKASDTHAEQGCELCVVKDAQTEHIAVRVRIIARADERWLCYCHVQNLTRQREAEQRERDTHTRLRTIMSSIRGGIVAVTRAKDGHYPVAFANDGFFRLSGYTKEQYAAEVPSVDRLVLPEDAETVETAVVEAMSGGQPRICEYRLRRRDGSVLWVQMVISAMELEGLGGPAVLGMMTDITAEHKRMELITFLNESAHALLSQPDADKAIEQVLENILGYFNSRRAYVFEIDDKRGTLNCSYAVCVPGVEARFDVLGNVGLDGVRGWIESFKDRTPVLVTVDDAPIAGHEGALALMRAQGVRSLISAPMLRDGGLIGFVVAEDPTRDTDQLAHISALGDYAALLLRRRDLNRRIEQEHELIEQVVNALPGGFARLRLGADGKAELVYANEGLKKMCGYQGGEIGEIFRDSLRACVHPEDRGAVNAMLEGLPRSVGVGSTRCRARRKDGTYAWISVSVRATSSAEGEEYLNIYCTDTSAAETEDELRRSILNNLPVGAALFEFYPDGRMNTLYINERMNELMKRDPNTPLGSFASMSGLHPDDRAEMIQEALDAIREDRIGTCVSRFRCGDGGYCWLRVRSCFRPREDGSYLVYSTYSLADGEMKDKGNGNIT